MALAMQHLDQLENTIFEVVPKVEMDGSDPWDHSKVWVDIPAARLVLEVALVGSEPEMVTVDLEDCKVALAGHKIVPTGPKVVPVRVSLVGRTHTLATPKVVPKMVVLVGGIPLLNRRLSLKGLSFLVIRFPRQGRYKIVNELISLRSRKIDGVAMLIILEQK